MGGLKSRQLPTNPLGGWLPTRPWCQRAIDNRIVVPYFYSGVEEIGNLQKSNEVRDMGYQNIISCTPCYALCPYVVQLERFPSSILVCGPLQVFAESSRRQ